MPDAAFDRGQDKPTSSSAPTVRFTPTPPTPTALDVDCPSCGAMRGRPCETFWRLRPCDPHLSRVKAARP